MKTLEVNGYKYSRKEFKDYGFRAKVRINFVELKDGKVVSDYVSMDIYTTDPDRESVQRVLEDRRTDKVTSICIEYWCTKEQDDASAAFIEEFLNDENE